jgi:uncharacterized NAD(P)/FAD-binding protein YdhS
VTDRRVVVVGGGASGGLVALQLLRRGGAGLEVVVLEPRPEVGLGVAFSTRDPWHRLNVAAATMSALPEDPEHFRRWAGARPEAFLSRLTWGRYLGQLIDESVAGSAARLVHRRVRAERLATGEGSGVAGGSGGLAGGGARLAVTTGGLAVTTSTGEVIAADAVVIATGNELPPVPSFLRDVRLHPAFIADPWAAAALEPVGDGETVAIVGSGLTAVDLAATLIRGRPACRVVMLSRHGDLPRSQENPWRPRPPEPVLRVDELAAAPDPFAFARERIAGHPNGWRQGLDSLRPITTALWRSMDVEHRRRFVDQWRHAWEIRRSRVAAEVIRDVEAWIAGGRLDVRAGGVAAVEDEGGRLRVMSAGNGPALLADHVLLATGPDERPAANPFLAAAIDDGLVREGPLGLGIDVDPDTLRVVDGSGVAGRAVWALGPVLKGALWETTAIPEIRVQAQRIAKAVLGEG